VSHTTLVIGDKTLKFHRHCPLVLLTDVGWRQVRALGNEEGKALGSLAVLSLQQRKQVGHMCCFCIRMAAL
jgi:hypothetical protein